MVSFFGKVPAFKPSVRKITREEFAQLPDSDVFLSTTGSFICEYSEDPACFDEDRIDIWEGEENIPANIRNLEFTDNYWGLFADTDNSGEEKLIGGCRTRFSPKDIGWTNCFGYDDQIDSIKNYLRCHADKNDQIDLFDPFLFIDGVIIRPEVRSAYLESFLIRESMYLANPERILTFLYPPGDYFCNDCEPQYDYLYDNSGFKLIPNSDMWFFDDVEVFYLNPQTPIKSLITIESDSAFLQDKYLSLLSQVLTNKGVGHQIVRTDAKPNKEESLNPFAATTLFVADQYCQYMQTWKDVFDKGDLVITDVSTPSEILRQCVKFSNDDGGSVDCDPRFEMERDYLKGAWFPYKSSRELFVNWANSFAHEKVGLPKPIVIHLTDLTDHSANPVSLTNKKNESKEKLFKKFNMIELYCNRYPDGREKSDQELLNEILRIICFYHCLPETKLID